MPLRAAMILKTIVDPVVLADYYADLAAYDYLAAVQAIGLWTDAARDYIHSLADSLRAWLDACQELAAR